ncbi:helix-turn-helix domain-containing protein [Nocardia sp. NPDC060259]|uniref:helix-turn-helix domain-containing protein n=1 Tax=Nocardia sp. NPDC060259 TaxID=3347088 RepID=UPI00364F14D9
MSTEFSKWKDVKTRARQQDPRSSAERAAGSRKADERHESYLRGHQLAEIRKAMGITQVALADTLGVTQARVSKIERGEISGIDAIRSYVAALGGSVDVVVRLGDRTWNVA